MRVAAWLHHVASSPPKSTEVLWFACGLAHDWRTVAVPRHRLGDALTRRSRLAEAGVELAAAIDIPPDIDARVIEAQARVHRGRSQLARGDLERAAAEAELAVRAGDTLGDTSAAARLGQIAHEDGDLKRAEEHAREALRLADDALQARAIARAERLLGSGHGSRRSRGRDRASRPQRGDPPPHRAQIEVGETLLARAGAAASGEGAHALPRAARRLFRRCRARLLLKRAERLLADDRNSAPAKNGRGHSVVDEQARK